MSITVKLIVCCDKKYGIGMKNKLPWCIPEDMKIFRDKTIGNKNNCVIMGRKSANSIPSKYFPLKDRCNCVLSHSLSSQENVKIMRNEEEMLNFIQQNKYDTYWIIGGAQIYNLFLNKSYVDEIHISILKDSWDCDTYFDENALKQYVKIEGTEYELFNHYVFKRKKDCP